MTNKCLLNQATPGDGWSLIQMGLYSSRPFLSKPAD